MAELMWCVTVTWARGEDDSSPPYLQIWTDGFNAALGHIADLHPKIESGEIDKVTLTQEVMPS
jgi:hypothetical protein